MQAPLDPTILINLLLTFFLLAIFMWLFIYLTRGRGGISNSFINDDEGHQNASLADIQASKIDNAFNNKKKGQQFFPGLRVTSGESSQAPNLEENRILNILLQFIAELFGRGKYPANSKGKQI